MTEAAILVSVTVTVSVTLVFYVTEAAILASVTVTPVFYVLCNSYRGSHPCHCQCDCSPCILCDKRQLVAELSYPCQCISVSVIIIIIQISYIAR